MSHQDAALKIISGLNRAFFSSREYGLILSIAKGEAEPFSIAECKDIERVGEAPNMAAALVKEALKKRLQEGGSAEILKPTPELDPFQEGIEHKVKPRMARGEHVEASDYLIDLCERFDKHPYVEANKLGLRLPADEATKERTKALARRVSYDPDKGYAPRFLTLFSIPGELPMQKLRIGDNVQYEADGETPIMVPMDRYQQKVGKEVINYVAGDPEIGLASGTDCILVELAIATKYLRQPKQESGRRDPVLRLGKTKEEFFNTFGRYNNPFYKEFLVNALERFVNTSRTIREVDQEGNTVKTKLKGLRVGDLYGEYSNNEGSTDCYGDWVGVLELTLEYCDYLERNFLHVSLSVADKLVNSDRDMSLYLWLVNKASWFTYNGNSKKELKLSYDEIGELYGDQIVRHDNKVTKIRDSFEKVLGLSGLPLFIDASDTKEVIIRHSALAQFVGAKKRSKK